MKTFTLIAVAISICLAGCNKQVAERSESDHVAAAKSQKTPSSTLAAEYIPNGRWIHNPLHCQGELPVIGPYDFAVVNDAITYIGVTEKGSWHEDNIKAKEAFANFLAENESCLSAKIGSFKLIRFDGSSSQYTLAYARNEKLLLRLNGDDVQLIVPFDIEQIKKLHIVDNSSNGENENENQS